MLSIKIPFLLERGAFKKDALWIQNRSMTHFTAQVFDGTAVAECSMSTLTLGMQTAILLECGAFKLYAL